MKTYKFQRVEFNNGSIELVFFALNEDYTIEVKRVKYITNVLESDFEDTDDLTNFMFDIGLMVKEFLNTN